MTRFVLDRPHDDRTTAPGVVANGRLTAATGTLLTLLLLVEGWTVLDVRGYITLHTALGLVLIGPVLLKSATTGYRFLRYYGRDDSYRRRGAPPLVVRVIGPFVVLSTLALLGTGIALLVDRGHSDTWLTLHQASFIVWVSLTGVHFLAHIVEALRGTGREIRASAADPVARGRLLRLGVVVASLALGIVLAAAFTPSASAWHFHHDFGPHHGFQHRS